MKLTKRDRNDLALMKAQGIHATLTDCQSLDHAIFELSRWGAGMKRGDLATSAALINHSNPTCVSVTLANRAYFLRLQRLLKQGGNPELTRLLTTAEEPDVLRLLLIAGDDDMGHSTLTLSEMKEATIAR